jgi:proteasome lid subunit RPN8/RPN11
MRAHVAAASPEEACGLLAGRAGQTAHIFEIENELHSATRYRMAPKQQLEAFMEMEERGWELLAIYHSHPSGPVGPSATDLAEALYPEALHLIWSRAEGKWVGRAYRFDANTAVEMDFELAK